MNTQLYGMAQRGMTFLKSAVYQLLAENIDGLSNVEIGRRLGINIGHIGHEGHISRTILGLLEHEEVVAQDKTSKKWRLRFPK